MSEPLRVEIANRVARITLTRAEQANTVDIGLAQALGSLIDDLSQSDVRVVIIAGEGRSFCGGGDIREVANAADPAAHLEELARTFHSALLGLETLPAVVITEVGGAVAGGGLGLILHSDVTIAGESARFLTAYDRIGLTPDSGVTSLLPRAIGSRRALELSVTGRILDAATARDWGLVAEVVSDDELATTVDALAFRLAAEPVDHLVTTRHLIRAEPASHPARLDDEAVEIARSAGRDPTRERIRAFGASPHERSS